jgi:hypothetical protein
MEPLLLLGVAVTELLRTLVVLRVQRLAVFSELVGGATMLLLKPFGDPGLELIKFDLTVIDTLQTYYNF